MEEALVWRRVPGNFTLQSDLSYFQNCLFQVLLKPTSKQQSLVKAAKPPWGKSGDIGVTGWGFGAARVCSAAQTPAPSVVTVLLNPPIWVDSKIWSSCSDVLTKYGWLKSPIYMKKISVWEILKGFVSKMSVYSIRRGLLKGCWMHQTAKWDLWLWRITNYSNGGISYVIFSPFLTTQPLANFPLESKNSALQALSCSCSLHQC